MTEFKDLCKWAKMVHKKVKKVGVILSTLSVDKIVYKALNFGSKPNFYRIFNKLYKN